MSDDIRFWDRVKSGLDTGLSSSKKVMGSARKKSRELEEYGILKIDIKRLEARNSELFNDLGVKVFSLFTEEGRKTISPGNPVIKNTIEELERNRAMLDSKIEKLAKIGGDGS